MSGPLPTGDGAGARPLAELLAERPLPPVSGDKHARGTAVVVAGDVGCPGAALLSVTAALRAGAGKVQLATHPDLCTSLGVAVPELFVLGWDGTVHPPDELCRRLARADAVLVGPGLVRGAEEAARLVAAATPPGVPLVLDARSLPAAVDLAASHPIVVAPNVDEAADLVDADGDPDDLELLAGAVTGRLGCPVAVRGASTVLYDGRRLWRSGGADGLGTAGSGDVLAGLLTGFLARGLDATAALGWAIAVHCRAGETLAGGRANPGYLARELLDAVPDAVATLGA